MTETTRDAALMWLNDRIGERVMVTVTVDRGDWTTALLEVIGELRHSDPVSSGEHGETLAGLYTVGDPGALDLTDLPDEAFSLRGRELRAAIDEHTEILVTHPLRPAPQRQFS